MFKKMLLGLIPAVALAGSVRADELDAFVDVASDSSFEIDALAAALDGDDLLVDDAEVMPMLGSEMMDEMDDIDADAVGFYYRRFRRSYYGGYRGYRSYGYRHYRYRSYGYGHYYRPVYRHTYYRPAYVYRSYCW